MAVDFMRLPGRVSHPFILFQIHMMHLQKMLA